VGQQFLWNFQYAGPDGKFGRRDIKLVSASNPLGLDRSDPDAVDDLTTRNEMHLPVNKPCIVDVMSKDVIHDFCIPNMRVAQDAIPGSIIPLVVCPGQNRHLRHRVRPALRQQPFGDEGPRSWSKAKPITKSGSMKRPSSAAPRSSPAQPRFAFLPRPR
jgi:hypothetical protein